jgi:drug/metabolite transporter (DMT)-like permease
MNQRQRYTKEAGPGAFTAAEPQRARGNNQYWARYNPFSFRRRSKRFKALLSLALICFFWGTTWVVAKQGVTHLPGHNPFVALQMAGLRQLLAGCCFVGFFMVKRSAWPTPKQWRIIVMLSLLNFMLSNALATWGMRFLPASLGAIISAIYPIWLVLIGLATGDGKLGIKPLSGILLDFGGICIIFYERLHEFVNPAFLVGILISVASTWSWAFGTLYTKKHAAGFNPYFSLGLQMMLSGIVLLTGMEASGQSVPLNTIPWQSWSAIVYLALFGSVITFVAFIYALQNLPMAQVSLYAYINPVVAVLLGAALIGEPITPFIAIGTAVTLRGVYVVNKAITRR